MRDRRNIHAPASGSASIHYRHAPVPRWAWALCWGLLAFLGLAMPLIQPSDNPFYVDLLAYVLAWGIVVWIALLTLWSVNRYGRVTVTASELRVGRQQLPLAALDAARLRAQAEAHDQGRGLPWPVSRPARLLGGAYAAPFGAREMFLPLADGTAVRVATKDGRGLLRALDLVLSSQESLPG